MNFAGVFAPSPTPFDDRDRVDTARLKAALQKWVATPLDGFVVLGSNGEAALMDDFECDQAIVAAHHLQISNQAFLELVRDRLERFERKAGQAETAKHGD